MSNTGAVPVSLRSRTAGYRRAFRRRRRMVGDGAAASRETIMGDLPVYRLNLLRAGYALIAVGLAVQIWPQIIDPATHWELQRSVVVSMLGAMGLLSLLGLRYPLRMLPLLFFEVAWKVIWTARVALPAYLDGRLDEATASIFASCLVVLLVVAAMPWDYIVARFALAKGEPWIGRRESRAKEPAA
jgi:hypothetical protein